MTNEATKVELTNSNGFPRRFTIASSATIAKGSLLKFSDARTAALSSAPYDYIAGVASMEKEADNSTSITAWTDGIFEMVASGAITAGHNVVSFSDSNYPNVIGTAFGNTAASGAAIFGYALETASDGETINVRVRT